MQSETSSHTWRAGKDQREVGHSRLAGGRLNKEGEVHMRLVLGGHKMSRFSHPPARIFKVSIKALAGVGHVCHPDGLNNLLSQGYVLRSASLWEWWAERPFQAKGKAVRSSGLPGPACRSPGGHVLSGTSSNSGRWGDFIQTWTSDFS